MSTATAEAAAPPAAGGKKKLIIIIAAALVVVLGGGGGAYMAFKPKPDAEEGADDGGHAAKPKARSKAKADADNPVAAARARGHDPKNPPVYVPLDPFTVNLADRDTERFAQIGITLQLDDAKVGEELKAYMPAIRNNVLMVLSSKTSTQLLTREGKDKLARQVLLATVRPLGFPTAEEDDDEEAADDAPPANAKKRKRRAPQQLVYPVVAVHFSTFIVQ
jgi:flagellar protein FliL